MTLYEQALRQVMQAQGMMPQNPMSPSRLSGGDGMNGHITMSKFNLGDRVRVISQSRGWGQVSPGDIGIISNKGLGGNIEVDFPSQRNWSCSEKDLELINNTSPTGDKNTMKTRKEIRSFQMRALEGAKSKTFKVGDKVKFIHSIDSDVPCDEFVEITGISIRDDEIRIRSQVRGSGYGRDNSLGDCFEMQIEIEIPEPITNLSNDCLDKVVLPKETKEEIIAVLKQHQHQNKIFQDWGLADTIEYGKGMTFLFYGTPGTGKTWCATQIAKATGRELLTLTPAEVQSQEPGGANRAIQQAFKTAKEQNKVVLLDECDSLITERGDVGMILSSEINTLLTEIEKFEGVCVLTTNRIDTLDQALERRISLIVEFQEPDFVTREMLWTKLLPSKLPLGKDVKIQKLAEYKLTGGQIKNVILQSARQAAANEEKQVDLKYFEASIARINKSKNLMGTASRYRQIKVKDGMGVSQGQGFDKVQKNIEIQKETKKESEKVSA